MKREESIIVKRVRESRHAHHGGSWKIAFADFATAMMAFFLVLWLLENTTEEQKIEIAGYFQDPVAWSERASPYVVDLGGSPTMVVDQGMGSPIQDQDQTSRLSAEQVTTLAEEIEKQRLEALLQELQARVEDNEVLRRFKDNLIMDITPEGLRIQVVDDDKSSMFDSGYSQLKYYFEDVLLELAPLIKSVPNKISISGHTDATPYSKKEDFGNWELSAARANSARRTLVYGGIPEEQVAQIVGLGDSNLFDPEHPYNPVNRRIDILIMSKQTETKVERMTQASPSPQKPLFDQRGKSNIDDVRQRARANQPDAESLKQ
ncbi:flagellar motor protein MotB [Zooshikella sp. RANM57]|uniref:flagellar motor protein MotB n=1 Tax=Zooshikella sp. RANM57 TaxID=3425863 RepID=UPI003D6EE4B9